MMAMFAVFLFDFIFPSNLITRLNFFSFYVTCLIMVLLGRIVLLTTMKIQNVMKIYNFVLFTFSIYHITSDASHLHILFVGTPRFLSICLFFEKMARGSLFWKLISQFFFQFKQTKKPDDKTTSESRCQGFFVVLSANKLFQHNPVLLVENGKEKKQKTSKSVTFTFQSIIHLSWNEHSLFFACYCE